jgi:hypothetical protein
VKLALVVLVVQQQRVHISALLGNVGSLWNLLVAILGVTMNSSEEAMELASSGETGAEENPSEVLASSAHFGDDG